MPPKYSTVQDSVSGSGARCNYRRFVLMMAGPDSNYHPIVLIKSILETMKRREKKENVILYLLMRIKQFRFLFSCHLEARSLMSLGDYSEVYSNVWCDGCWCSVPIKICCHAGQTTRNTKSLYHDRAPVFSACWGLHLSEAFPVPKSDLGRWYLDTGTIKGKYSPKTILIYESLGHCVALHPGGDKVCPSPGIMAESRHGGHGGRWAGGGKTPSQVTRY